MWSANSPGDGENENGDTICEPVTRDSVLLSDSDCCSCCSSSQRETDGRREVLKQGSGIFLFDWLNKWG
jgi:hypothetical protein